MPHLPEPIKRDDKKRPKKQNKKTKKNPCHVIDSLLDTPHLTACSLLDCHAFDHRTSWLRVYLKKILMLLGYSGLLIIIPHALIWPIAFFCILYVLACSYVRNECTSHPITVMRDNISRKNIYIYMYIYIKLCLSPLLLRKSLPLSPNHFYLALNLSTSSWDKPPVSPPPQSLGLLIGRINLFLRKPPRFHCSYLIWIFPPTCPEDIWTLVFLVCGGVIIHSSGPRFLLLCHHRG